MVALGALMSCVAVGAMYSLAVFLQPMTEDTGCSTTYRFKPPARSFTYSSGTRLMKL